jgi:hypothetical protein
MQAPDAAPCLVGCWLGRVFVLLADGLSLLRLWQQSRWSAMPQGDNGRHIGRGPETTLCCYWVQQVLA